MKKTEKGCGARLSCLLPSCAAAAVGCYLLSVFNLLILLICLFINNKKEFKITAIIAVYVHCSAAVGCGRLRPHSRATRSAAAAAVAAAAAATAAAATTIDV